MADPQTSEVIPIHPLTTLGLKGQDTGLSWSPDGNLLSFVFSPEEARAALQYYLLVADLSAGEICPLLPDLAMVSLPMWSPDGEYLAVNNGDKNALMVIPLDDLDSPFIIEDVTSRAPPSWYGPDRVAYGRTTADMVGEIVVQSLDQSAPSLILTDVPWLAAFAISPDGQWLAYDARGARINDLSSGEEVYRGDPERYVRAWSPTGDLLLLSGGTAGSWVLDAQEGFSRLPITTFGSYSYQSFSPDERYLVYTTMAEGVPDQYLEIIEISSSEIRRLEIPDQHPSSAVWNPE